MWINPQNPGEKIPKKIARNPIPTYISRISQTRKKTLTYLSHNPKTLSIFHISLSQKNTYFPYISLEKSLPIFFLRRISVNLLVFEDLSCIPPTRKRIRVQYLSQSLTHLSPMTENSHVRFNISHISI